MNRSSDNASLVLPSTGPSVAILLTHCLGHSSFSCTEYLILTAVNFKQPFSVCFSNFVYSDRFSILGWGGLEAKYLLVPSFRDKTEKRDRACSAAAASGECRNDSGREKTASDDRHADGDWRQDLGGTHHSDTLGGLSGACSQSSV